MSEKAMKSNKSIILLRSFLVVSMVAVLVFGCVPFSASAADSYKQWSDFPFTSTTVGGAVNYTIDFSSGGNYTIRRWSPFQEIELGTNPQYLIDQSGTYTLVYYTSRFEYDTLFFTGAESSFSFAYEFYGGYRSLEFTDSYVYVLCFDANGDYLTTELFEAAYDSSTGLYTAHFVPRVPSGTAYVQLASALYFRIEIITEENEATPVVFPISTFDYSFSLPVDSVQNQEIIDKLDGVNDKLDSLPGDIGDEMQDVIENEKEQSKDEGNKFVDLILDALPDPSTDVLASLKSLTYATAYNGTDAVLPIPAIVLPGIDGLFPETVIWEGAEFDFGYYIGFIPASLLILVRSLFTIAIVLYCVYEFKGIISYCLTLRESKGG